MPPVELCIFFSAPLFRKFYVLNPQKESAGRRLCQNYKSRGKTLLLSKCCITCDTFIFPSFTREKPLSSIPYSRTDVQKMLRNAT